MNGKVGAGSEGGCLIISEVSDSIGAFTTNSIGMSCL